VGFAIDVTARRKAEEWLEGLIAATQDAVISIDRHARLVRFNPAAEKISLISGNG
jgi:PAS domain-containing protein